MFEKVFTKSQVLTIPNLLSLVRLILIPCIVITYFRQQYTASLILIAISAFSDVIDGPIARHFDMASDLGKMLDPLADKLTEGALIICLATRYKLMIVLFLVMAAKEALMVIMGLKAMKKDSINSARWYGKVYTVLIYAVIMALLLFTRIPVRWANTMIVVCIGVAVFTMIMYYRFYHQIIQESCI